MKCSKCGADLQEGALFCRECGTKVEKQMSKNFCRECGSELTEGVKFCPNCGANVTAVDDVVLGETVEKGKADHEENKEISNSGTNENDNDSLKEEQTSGQEKLSKYQHIAVENKSFGEKIKKNKNILLKYID